jgi:alpha-D-glucose phosphate-specific phosphoglucomutase
MPTPTDIRFGTDGWRAVIAEDFTYANLRRVADAAGRVFAEDHPGGRILIGYDTRFQAGAFAQAAAEVLASHGLDAVVSDRYTPTPALCWSVSRDDGAVGGVMLTASHNPAPYLGFKLRMEDGGASPVSFTQRVEAALLPEPPEPPRSPASDGAAASTSASASGGVRTADLMGPYLASLRGMVDESAIRAAGSRVAVDPLYGAGQTYLAETLRSLGVDVTEIHGELNPGFGGLHPEPIPPHIDEVSALVRAGGFDAAFVTDGDADRIGAVDEHGGFVNPHRILCLVTRHLVEDKGMTGKVVKTLSTSVLVDRLASHLGLEVVTTPVGFKWIYEEMVKGGVLIGGEESGGIGVPSHVRERDGLLMSLFLAEMMAQRKMTLAQLVEDLLAVTGPMEYLRNDLRLEPAVVDAFRAAMPNIAPSEVAGLTVRDIVRADGVKFLLQDDAWLLMRTSGTEPLVRVYAEASSMGVVDELLAAGASIVTGSAR